MFLVLDDETEQELFRVALSLIAPGPVALPDFNATLSLSEDLIILRPAGREPGYGSGVAGNLLPCYGRLCVEDEQSSYPEQAAQAGNPRVLLLAVFPGAPPVLQAVYFPSGSSPGQVCDTEVVRPDTRMFSWAQGPADRRVLAQKIVSVIDAGSRGSLGALELVKAGVGSLHLVDFDRLRADDVSSHICGLADVGRFKTRAVRDAVLQHNPRASVVCNQVDITEHRGLLERIVQSSDLVFVATGNEQSKYVINDVCLEFAKPAVYGDSRHWALPREVIRVIPGETGCYACLRQGLANAAQSISGQEASEHTHDGDRQDNLSRGLDVSFIAMIQTMVALNTLLGDNQSAPEDPDANAPVWTHPAQPQGGQLLHRLLARNLTGVPKVADCAACGGVQGYPGVEESLL